MNLKVFIQKTALGAGVTVAGLALGAGLAEAVFLRPQLRPAYVLDSAPHYREYLNQEVRPKLLRNLASAEGRARGPAPESPRKLRDLMVCTTDPKKAVTGVALGDACVPLR